MIIFAIFSSDSGLACHKINKPETDYLFPSKRAPIGPDLDRSLPIGRFFDVNFVNSKFSTQNVLLTLSINRLTFINCVVMKLYFCFIGTCLNMFSGVDNPGEKFCDILVKDLLFPLCTFL